MSVPLQLPATNNNIQTVDIPHSQTLYVNNLSEKVRISELKKGLYHVFSQFGNVIEIVATKSYALKGQAWVIFDNLASSTRAHSEMANFLFFGKPMRVQYARSKSDVVAKAEGTFVARPKRKGVDDKEKEGTKFRRDREGKKPKPHKIAAAAAAAAAASKAQAAGANKDKTGDNEDSNTMQTEHAPLPPVTAREVNEPNKILFVENLPDAANELMLGMLFQQYPGYRESRMVPGRPGIAFVEFEAENQSAVALEALQNFKVTSTNFMRITFAKK